MYLCQAIERFSQKARYIPYYRVVWYRVTKTDAEGLRWELHRQGKWHSRGVSAKEVARRDMTPGVAEMPDVFAGKPVTDKEIAKLTGLAGFAGRDFLREIDLDHPTVVKMPEKLKPTPTKADANAEKLAKATEKVAEFDRKLKRLTTLRKKWERRRKLYERKATESTKAE